MKTSPPRFLWTCVFWTSLAFYLSVCPAAQAQNADRSAINVQRFQPVVDLHGLFQTLSARPVGQGGWAFGGHLHYTDRPLAGGDAKGQPIGLLTQQWQMDLVGVVGLLSWLEVGARVPLLAQTGAFPDTRLLYGSLSGQSLDGFFLSDVQLSTKITLLGRNRTGFCLGLLGFVTLPVAFWLGQSQQKMSGDNGIGGGGSLLLSRHGERFRIAVNLGYRFHTPTQLLNLNISHELRVSAGVAWSLLPKRLELMVDVFGSMFLERTDLFQLPFEAQAGLRFYPFARSSFSITAGAGAPLSPGMGVGRFRVFVSLLWSRSKEVFADTDRDGLADFKDDCPRRYGSLSNRGCPWPDKDGDGTDDRMDRCPVVRGPIKNYGCPWPDTDGDGLADNEDRCPRRQGALKNEGCPWPDKDGDGLANHEDRCPAESGPRHNRGCPVQVQRVVHKVQVLPLVQQKLPSLYFAFNHWGLHKTTTFKLRTILRHLRRFPRHQLVLEGYADSPGTRDYNLWLSRKRALAVMTRLLRAGISPKRLSVRGMGNQASLLLVRKKRRQARFRRVDFVIVQKEPAS